MTSSTVSAALVCGIDAGGWGKLSFVAWLSGTAFTLDLYVPSTRAPLPRPPTALGLPACFAFDAPQGLPKLGERRRDADAKANTPTRVLPPARQQIGAPGYAFSSLVQTGIEIFWECFADNVADVFGIAGAQGFRALLVETYPRYVLRRLWPQVPIPSKTKAPLQYLHTFWPRVQQLGYACAGVAQPTVDQLDAMVCAIVAQRLVVARADGGQLSGTVGVAPYPDQTGQVLREGYIVAP